MKTRKRKDLRSYKDKRPFKPWERDGYESELHYLVAMKHPVMWDAALNDTTHPFYERAKRAAKMGLFPSVLISGA